MFIGSWPYVAVGVLTIKPALEGMTKVRIKMLKILSALLTSGKVRTRKERLAWQNLKITKTRLKLSVNR